VLGGPVPEWRKLLDHTFAAAIAAHEMQGITSPRPRTLHGGQWQSVYLYLARFHLSYIIPIPEQPSLVHHRVST